MLDSEMTVESTVNGCQLDPFKEYSKSTVYDGDPIFFIDTVEFASTAVNVSSVSFLTTFQSTGMFDGPLTSESSLPQINYPV